MKKKSKMTITEAVDNLSSMAEIDPEALKSEKQAYKEGDLDPFEKRQWLDITDEEKTYASVKESFQVVHNYLKKVYVKEKETLSDVDTQKGIHAMMQLAGEAAEKLSSCKGLFQKAHKNEDFKEIEEFKNLQEFYLSKIVKKFERAIEREEAWQEEWGGPVDEDKLDIERRGLKELEQVRKDRKYEFFFIRKEDGKPFFNRNLLRHIRLVTDFDDMVIDHYGDDPLLRVRTIQDKQAHKMAEDLRETTRSGIKKYLINALKFKNQKLMKLTTNSVMALFFASNYRNLIQHTTAKSCLGYFQDFLYYMRESLTSLDFARAARKSSSEQDSHIKAALELINQFCTGLHKQVVKKDDAIGFIYQIIKKGGESRENHRMKSEPLSMWNALYDYHDSLRNVLLRYPNGPLMLLIDLFDEKEQRIGYEPFKIDNYPSKEYEVKCDTLNIDVLRLPSPTYQEVIDKATIIPEFNQYIEGIKKGRLLLINLQDKTSFEESARCSALEGFAQRHLVVATLPKNTPFYHQAESYSNLNDAKEFIDNLKSQILSGEECGFHFPKKILKKDLRAFLTKVLPFIHKTYFSKNGTLTRKNRLDFIEITYQFLILKLIETIEPTELSFTCKDAIDIGAMQLAGFYSYLKLMSRDPIFSDEERDFLVWLIFAPALLIRNRAVDGHRLSRTVSSLSVMSAALEANPKALIKEAEALFERPVFSKLRLNESVD